MLTAPEIIQHLEQRIEELRAEIRYYENTPLSESYFKIQFAENLLGELESLINKAKGI